MSLLSRRIPVTAAAAALMVGASVLGATAAQAAPPKPYGKVVASALNVRQYPSTDSSVLSVVYKGELLPLDCKVRAQYINGNTIWYKIRYNEEWVSARYVDNYGSVPLCKDKYPNRLNNSKMAENAMG